MIEMVILLAWEAAAAGLFWSCLCRGAYTHKGNTQRDVRWAFQGLGVLALMCLAAPFYGYAPDGFAIALLVWVTILQIVTAHHWRAGVPAQFQRGRS